MQPFIHSSKQPTEQPRRRPQPHTLLPLVGVTIAVVALVLSLSPPALAQAGLTVPPSGGNQKASVTQQLGLVTVSVDYSSPDVTAPDGTDRRGNIWGQLVPWGLSSAAFGNGKPMPWRAGANENTVFTTSHDIEIEGKPLAAGRYGLHMIPGEDEWTIIFSNNSASWGSFFYEEDEDALRVTTTAESAPYREWLTYDFTDRQLDTATLALHWEELRIPFEIKVPNSDELYLARIRDDLRDSPGFSWQAWVGASQFCLQGNRCLEQALEWADAAISRQFVGQENFATLQNRYQVLSALGRTDEAQGALAKLVDHRTTGPIQLHGVARQLQAAGNTEKAVELFKLNHERHGDVWPINVGLARAYSAEGKFKKALEYARKARAEAPDALNQGNLDTVIQLLEDGKDFNPTN